MSKRANRNRRRAPVAKAPSQMTAQQGRDVSELVNYITSYVNQRPGVDLDAQGRTLPWPIQWSTNPFGPGKPITMEPLDGPRQDGSGRPAPRVWQYPAQWNIFGTTRSDRPVPWDVLREAADAPLFRACIETRKTELSSLEWAIRPAASAVDRIAKHSRRGKQDVADELRQKYADEIDRETEFWTTPDRRNGYSFTDWIALLMEEELVYDAITVYPRRTYGGSVNDFLIIDGTTIKPLLDEQGGRPESPYPAYQQILYGFPRGEFTADVEKLPDGRQAINNAYPSDQMVYRRRSLRPQSPYGFPPCEQALLDGLLYNSRFRWMLGEYAENSIPAGWMKNDGTSDWNPRQILEYERAFNDRYSGNTQERFRMPLLPAGIEPYIPPGIPERYKADYDLHLIKLVCMHFGLTVSELGFIDKGGLGSVGYHEGQEDVNFRRQRIPDIRWYSDFVTTLGTRHRGMSPDLEFAFLALDAEDEAAEDEVWQNRVASGRATLNEDRARLKLAPYEFAEADMPQLQTARGIVFIQDASKVAPAGVLLEPAYERGESDEPGGLGAMSPTQRRPIGSGGGPQATQKALDELSAYGRWLGKHPDGSTPRPFRFEHMTAELANEMGFTPSLPVEYAKAGGSGPKDSAGGSQPPRIPPGQHGSSTSHLQPPTAGSSPLPWLAHSPWEDSQLSG